MRVVWRDGCADLAGPRRLLLNRKDRSGCFRKAGMGKRVSREEGRKERHGFPGDNDGRPGIRPMARRSAKSGLS
jgi:hypothetical protein